MTKLYQGKGYGRETVREVITTAKEQKECDILIANYVKGNEVMGNLLRSEGFIDHSFNEERNEHGYITDYETG